MVRGNAIISKKPRYYRLPRRGSIAVQLWGNAWQFGRRCHLSLLCAPFPVILCLQPSMTTQNPDSAESTWPTRASCVTTYDDHCPKKLGRTTAKKLHGLHADGEDPTINAVASPLKMAETIRGSRGAQSGPCLPRSQINQFTLLQYPEFVSWRQ